jgi:hypothetical protein
MVVYAETLPWLVELYMHTLEVRVDGVRVGECDYLLSLSFRFVSFFDPVSCSSIGCCLHALSCRERRRHA